ncbi:MAG: 50S ribosomal protein L6 [Chloroflexi bacterium]|nr:50S ribosomal protein L6 [Chloroflexota bacterium]
MSRIGQKPIPLPAGIEVTVEPGNRVTVKGPLGSEVAVFHPELSIKVVDGTARVARHSDERQYRALHGLTRALLNNMVLGVSQGFRRSLEIVGVGYRAQQAGNKVVLQVGFSHPVEYDPPPGIKLLVESATKVTVTGTNKQMVGQVAAELRRSRPPDPYKGKGVRYSGEVVHLRPGKAAGRKKQ